MRRAALDRLAAELADGRRWKVDRAQRVLEAWQASGESGEVFGRRLGVQAQRLCAWRRRLSTETGSASERPALGVGSGALVPVVVRSVARAGDDGGALAVAIGSVRVEVRKLDAATAHWIAVLARSLEQEGAS